MSQDFYSINELRFIICIALNRTWRLQKNKLQRQTLSKLRLSAHNPFIERGRHWKIPREERKCLVCGVVEDEIRFLESCTKFTREGKQFIYVANNYISGILTLQSIAKPSEVFVIDELQGYLAKLVFDCLNLLQTN